MTGSAIFPCRDLNILLGALLLLAVGTSLPSRAAAEGQASTESTADQHMDRRLDQLFGHHQDYRSFFEHFRQAVLAGDKAQVAAAMHYPITVHLEGKSWTLYNPKEFMGVYPHIMTPWVIDAVRHQIYADLFANDQGVMIGQGIIWFGGICEDAECEQMPLRVVALNLPAGH